MKVSARHDGATSGALNMERDLAMINDVRSGVVDISFRTYLWQPWCVSLGHNQPLTNIDQTRCSELGYDIVRRPTGGRAVLHANELTYCIVLAAGPTLGPKDVYTQVHEFLHEKLSLLVFALNLSESTNDLHSHYSAAGPVGQSCFTSHAKSEIMHGTLKVVGSAQRVIDGLVLQHGSILCGTGHQRIADCLIASHEERERLLLETSKSSTTLSDIAGRPISPDVVADVIHDGVETALRRRFIRAPFS
ncbi:MAG: hypothetical protein NTX15_01825 [Candidatus Kapabacteria bacterium]|nr:hypothetical protein [Candidatus Kapabacteria bacterium]